MQSKDSLEEWYSLVDPWGYATNPDDLQRKQRILEAIPEKDYQRALDIGAGEGFITVDLPAKEIEAIELSDAAAERLPKGIKRVAKPHGDYDLIVCTGMLYAQYDHQQFLDWIREHGIDIVVTSNIKDWEINDLPEDKQIYQVVFPYREYEQILRVYKL